MKPNSWDKNNKRSVTKLKLTFWPLRNIYWRGSCYQLLTDNSHLKRESQFSNPSITLIHLDDFMVQTSGAATSVKITSIERVCFHSLRLRHDRDPSGEFHSQLASQRALSDWRQQSCPSGLHCSQLVAIVWDYVQGFRQVLIIYTSKFRNVPSFHTVIPLVMSIISQHSYRCPVTSSPSKKERNVYIYLHIYRLCFYYSYFTATCLQRS